MPARFSAFFPRRGLLGRAPALSLTPAPAREGQAHLARSERHLGALGRARCRQKSRLGGGHSCPQPAFSTSEFADVLSGEEGLRDEKGQVQRPEGKGENVSLLSLHFPACKMGRTVVHLPHEVVRIKSLLTNQSSL